MSSHTPSFCFTGRWTVRIGTGALFSTCRRAATWFGGRRTSAPATSAFLSGLAILVLALCLLGACAPLTMLPEQIEDVASTEAPPDQSEYRQALKAWTRSGNIYRKFATELLVAATYHALPFRQAYVTAYAQAGQLNPEQKESLWQRQVAEAGEFHEFLLAFYVPDEQAPDLATPVSSWRLYLENGGGDRLSPMEIRRIRKVTPFITRFYPYVTPWAKVYKVRFPVRHPLSGVPVPGPGDQILSLVITSPSGMVRLTWQPESGAPLSSPADGSQDPGGEQSGQKKDQRSTPSPN